MGRAMQGETAQQNLKCVQLKSRVGICQQDPVVSKIQYKVHACSKLLYSFPLGSYSSYAKVTELKESRRVEQFAEERERS
jgi:hypothetical protein